jgi:hypothetical protein
MLFLSFLSQSISYIGQWDLDYMTHGDIYQEILFNGAAAIIYEVNKYRFLKDQQKCKCDFFSFFYFFSLSYSPLL